MASNTSASKTPFLVAEVFMNLSAENTMNEAGLSHWEVRDGSGVVVKVSFEESIVSDKHQRRIVEYIRKGVEQADKERRDR